MSMLAEPRRKQKWSVDPRNSAWSNDDSKFGQKMLERMGWSKGKGLGRSEQGSTDHIKVKVKNDSYGFGANASYEDNWIAHQDEFNDLLAQLNGHHGQNTTDETPSEEKKGFSLEEKSKTSKKRVHYMKFTKGKDLSSRSEKDLNCIFGKRTKPTKHQEPPEEAGSCRRNRSYKQENSKTNSPCESSECGTPSELDAESVTKTVTSSLSMQEYFAQRMAQLKKAREAQGPAEDVNSSSDDAEEPKKKKTKNKDIVEVMEVVEEQSSVFVIEDEDNQNQTCSRKKKKRKNTKHCADENCSSVIVLDDDCGEVIPSKKKKSKKKNRELLNGHAQTENTAEERVVIQEDVKECNREPVVKKSKKKKRKRGNQE
ncbi:PIN2/TERF1-interacting telomerase inhibitor 1 isoform X2 [Nothobranchius furzeri]|uniref:PIN2 (TERF1) interacting telomerase inhibitor 1 n=1 Tax=Nothobranchius furzeri TaxID=105023 RepID=A0A1A7ZYA9_NOTFU|nr:PIN2/TERF1-interacting telomerase inhibitor 1 isoform X2 [Nothobranchius furzeri]KAF7230463.1 transcript variant X4 [Nothobranchius furzeri]